MRSMVEGARASRLAALAPLHRTSCGPPPRSGEEPYRIAPLTHPCYTARQGGKTMYSDSDLEAAVAAGALSPEAAASLRNYVAGRAASPAVDEEHFRLITGFNDIFVSVAAAILFFALAWIGSTLGPRIDFDGPSPVGP